MIQLAKGTTRASRTRPSGTRRHDGQRQGATPCRRAASAPDAMRRPLAATLRSGPPAPCANRLYASCRDCGRCPGCDPVALYATGRRSDGHEAGSIPPMQKTEHLRRKFPKPATPARASAATPCIIKEYSAKRLQGRHDVVSAAITAGPEGRRFLSHRRTRRAVSTRGPAACRRAQARDASAARRGAASP